MLTDLTKTSHKNASFNCENCHFKTSNKYDYSKHLLTAKHLKTESLSQNEHNCEKNGEKNVSHICINCNKIYKSRVGLWGHKKKCVIHNKDESTEEAVIQDISSNQIEFIANMFKEVMKSNQEFQQQILELVKDKNVLGSITSNSHNTTNNKFNLNFFLNEQCKDAMNIMDFIKTMKITLEDFENIGTLGYAEGIGNLFISNLKTMEVVKRPIHCSDPKRETMYIKDKDTWENDKEKTLFISAIKNIAHQNFRKSIEWKEENPDYKDSSSKTMDKYNKIINESMGPQTKEEKERDYNKIMRRVAKEVTIDK